MAVHLTAASLLTDSVSVSGRQT